MSSLSDLVTQVKNPNEEEAEDEDDPFGVKKINVDAISTATGPNKAPLSPRSQNGFCTAFCCVSKDDDQDLKVSSPAKPSQEQQQTVTTPTSTSSAKWTVPRKPLNIPAPYPADRSSFNSPRPSDETTAVPWKDDQLLPPQRENKKGKKCLVLDLDETLVHSSFKPVDCDFVVPVEIENQVHQVYVGKRPYVDEFMRRCGELFETVIFTASLAKYADPVLDILDIHKAVDWRLFRESCTPLNGAYVKDMGRMGREINQIMIIDNSPHSYAFNPENAIPCESWFFDKNDRELLDLIPHLEALADPAVKDVREKLQELGYSALEILRSEASSFLIQPAQQGWRTGSSGTGHDGGTDVDADYTESE